MPADPTMDELKRRLELAERVCALYGGTGARGASDRDKATTQAWMEWHRAYGATAEWPSDSEVLELAARRDVTRNVTLLQIRKERGNAG